MSGLGSFLDGFVGGIDTRHKWDDRNRERAMQDEDRTWQREDRGYTLEERQRKRAREDKAQAEADRLAKEAEDERKANADAFSASQASDPGPAQPATGRSVMGGADAPAVEGPSVPLSFGADVGVMADPKADPYAAPPNATPVDGRFGRGLPAVDGRMGRGLPPPEPADGRMGRGLPNLVMQPGPTAEQWNAMTSAERDAYQPTMGPPIAQTVPTAQITIPDPTNVDSMAEDKRRAAAFAKASAQPAILQGEEDARRAATAASPPAAPAPSAPGNSVGMGRSIQQTGDTAAPTAAVLPAPNATPAQAIAASDPAAAQTNPAASPAVQAAVSTAPKVRFSFGIDSPITATPAQEKAATTSFLQNYLDKGVPKMVEFYLKRGDVAKAQAFMDWSKDAQSQENMKLWAKGVHAAAIGDETKMLDSFAKYYNNFDDGQDIVREKSGIRRDENGNMTGAFLTFRDKKTGQEHRQDFNGSEDLLQQGIMALSPEKMFEIMYTQNKEAQAADGQTEKLRVQLAIASMRTAGAHGFKTTPQRVQGIMSELQKSIIGFEKLPQDQQIALITDRIAAENQAAGMVDGTGGAPYVDYGPEGDPEADQ